MINPIVSSLVAAAALAGVALFSTSASSAGLPDGWGAIAERQTAPSATQIDYRYGKKHAHLRSRHRHGAPQHKRVHRKKIVHKHQARKSKAHSYGRSKKVHHHHYVSEYDYKYGHSHKAGRKKHAHKESLKRARKHYRKQQKLRLATKTFGFLFHGK